MKVGDKVRLNYKVTELTSETYSFLYKNNIVVTITSINNNLTFPVTVGVPKKYHEKFKHKTLVLKEDEVTPVRNYEQKIEEKYVI